jgi:serine/threonine protein kinase/Tol biopolymer transport system component
MSLAAGDKLGHYEILAKIGAGGMGEVYRARDPRVGRDVAIKVSSEKFSERFDREARVIASLNHPNICQLYDVGPNYLVMELVEGESPAGPLPLETALNYARQIADALEAAHEKGITHRDLKPGNIKITPAGVVKVLDFGLAKTGGIPSVQSENSPTLSMDETQAGVILGTAAYMAPEQAKGKPVDKRADIWAFGVVLYEMLTGQRLFRGETLQETLASVLKEEPNLDRAPAETRLLLKRCLEQDPKHRLRDIADAMPLALLTSQTRTVSPRLSWLWPGIAGLLLVTLALGAFLHFREKPPKPPELFRFQIETPALRNDGLFYMALSPDGRKLAYTAFGSDGVVRIWIRDMDTLESRMLAGTDVATSLFWSPDSRFVGFAAGSVLKKVEASGVAPPQTLCDVKNPVGMGSWSAGGVIIFSIRPGALQRVPASGGTPAELTTMLPGETIHTFPVFLPDGHHFLYYRGSGSPDVQGIYTSSLDAKPKDPPSKRILTTRYAFSFVPAEDSDVGTILFFRDNTVMAQAFDSRRLEPVGDPVAVAEHVASGGSTGWFTASASGGLAYRAGTGAAGSSYQLTWFDRKGTILSRVGDPANYPGEIALSPDGKTVASGSGSVGNGNLWLVEFARGVRSRFTFEPASYRFPVWSPDGSRIAFSSNRGGRNDLYQKTANGAGDEQLLGKTGLGTSPTSWSRDGRFLLYTGLDGATRGDLWVLPMEAGSGEAKPVGLQKTPFDEHDGVFSPDIRWIAYTSDETGRNEIYVRPFLPSGPSGTPALGEGKWQVSKDGGSLPKWTAGGKELIFLGPNSTLMAVEVTTAPTIRTGIPQTLFRVPQGATGWDVTADGKRILLAVLAGQDTPQPITMVLNWQAGLKK